MTIHFPWRHFGVGLINVSHTYRAYMHQFHWAPGTPRSMDRGEPGVPGVEP